MTENRLAAAVSVLFLFCAAGINVQADSDIVILTPRDSKVPDAMSRDEFETQQDITDNDSIYDKYYNDDQIIGHSSKKFNCHGYAWHMIGDNCLTDSVWIGLYSQHVDSIYWTDKSYSEIDEQYSTVSIYNPIIVRYVGDHSAVATSEQDTVISKWNDGPLMRHYKNNTPGYGLVEKYFRKNPSVPSTLYASVQSAMNDALPGQIVHVDSGAPVLTTDIIVPCGRTLNIHSGTEGVFANYNIIVRSGGAAIVDSGVVLSRNIIYRGQIADGVMWNYPVKIDSNATINRGATLTIADGIIITYEGSNFISVLNGGTVVVKGTITFYPSTQGFHYRGAMSTDNIWGFPVLVDSTLTVGSGKWLTILPGTTVRVNSGHKIKVDGKLTANGSSSLPITFTSASGTWAGIDLYCAEASSMSYCTVQNASTGVRAYQTDLTLDHCTFSSNSYSAVTFENQASGTITHSIFSGNATYAIRCLQYSNPVIRPVNRIWNNYGTAVSGDGSSLPDLGSYYNYGDNSIKNNYPDDIWSDNINTVYAQHNYWGSSSPEPYVSDNVECEPYLSSDPTGSLGKALAGQEVAAILHEKPSADTTGKQLFGKAYQAWIEGDTDAAGMQFAQLAQECPSSPAGLQALSMAVRCYDRNKDSDGAGSYLEKIIKEKSTSVISELAMSIKVGRLARLGKYDEAAGAAEQLLNSATDETLRKYALYDLATLLYHFLNDKQNGEKYYRQLLAEYPDDPLAEVAASVLGQSVDPPIEEKLAKASTLPTEYELLQNYPNPFNPETRIQFTLPEAAQVRIEVMNVLGQRIAVLCDGSMAADHHTVRWDGRTASGEKAGSGVYFCRLQAGGFIKTIKMMLLP